MAKVYAVVLLILGWTTLLGGVFVLARNYKVWGPSDPIVQSTGMLMLVAFLAIREGGKILKGKPKEEEQEEGTEGETVEEGSEEGDEEAPAEEGQEQKKG